MTNFKTIALVAATATAALISVAPASARDFHRDHRHQVCHIERHHGHAVRVCR